MVAYQAKNHIIIKKAAKKETFLINYFCLKYNYFKVNLSVIFFAKSKQFHCINISVFIYIFDLLTRLT